MPTETISPGVATLAAKFTQLFGRPDHLWIHYQGEWHQIQDAVDGSSQGRDRSTNLELRELPAGAETIRELTLTERSGGIFEIGTPLVVVAAGNPSARETGIAWGTVRTSFQELAGSLVRLSNETVQLTQDVQQLRQGFDPHLEQISSDFEQLTWLRRLGSQVEGTDATFSLADLARLILPDLCDLVCAEGLAFIEADTTTLSQDVTGQYITRPVIWSGRALLPDARCRDLVGRLGGDNPARIVVRNAVEGGLDDPIPGFPEVSSCVQMPVIHRGTCFGWLVAFNRIPWSQRSRFPETTAPTAFCDNAFGTGEAGLLTSAATTLAASARNSQLFREKELLLIGVVRSLINTIDAKDAYTCGHSDRVALMAKCIGQKLGLAKSECEQLFMSGLLHDIGKIGVPDHILRKPGKLTDEEFAAIRLHPVIGHAILKHLPQIQFVLPGVRHHHEMVDGRGYPDGLMGDAIPLFGRILAVADSYDAMTSARPYRSPMPVERAEAILQQGAGSQWDAHIVQVFLESRAAIEHSCRDADRHLEDLLRPTESASIWHDVEDDALTHAVTASHA